MAPDTAQAINRAAAALSAADGLVIAAGAGMGVDSGLPDFRGRAGFWRAYPALADSGIAFEDIANPEGFRRHIALSWGFYGHRLNLYRATVPHEGFALLKAWGETLPKGYSVFTSNIDGQFQKAGFEGSRIHECHGSIHHLQCSVPCSPFIWPAVRFLPEVDEQRCLLENDWPRCPKCYQPARPNVLMFSDGEWLDGRQRLQAQAQDRWLAQLQRPVVVEIGAGTAIPSVRRFAEWVAETRQGTLIRINPREPDVRRGQDVGLAMGALDALRSMARATHQAMSGAPRRTL